MPGPAPETIRWIALLSATALVTVLFLGMVEPFLVALVLAAITAAMSSKLQARMMIVTRKRKGLAATLTLLILCVCVVAPLIGVIFLAAQQAQSMADAASDLIEELQAISPDDPLPDWVPFRDQIGETAADIMAKLSEVAGEIGSYVANALGQLASGTATFFLNFFVYLYALFLFLQMDRSVILQVLSYSGLSPATQNELADRMVTVSRATIKGTLVIGGLQGLLGSLGFWAAGIEGAAFWGVIMVILSVIPGVGPLAVIFGGVIWLFTQGDTTPAIALAVWGVAVVGTVDNILRPILVGRDTALNDVIILISTLGGLAVFGASGLVLGPVLAGLFVTMWDTVAKQASSSGVTEGLPPEDPPDEQASELLDEELASELHDLRKKRADRMARLEAEGKSPPDQNT